MTRDEAQARAVELNAERADGDAATWIVTKTPEGDWRPVRVAAPGFKSFHPLKATVEAKPRPREADDVRPSTFRDVPPYGAGL